MGTTQAKNIMQELRLVGMLVSLRQASVKN